MGGEGGREAEKGRGMAIRRDWDAKAKGERLEMKKGNSR